MKKLTTIFTSCLFVFALSSCGGDADGSDASGSDNGEKDDKTEKDNKTEKNNCYDIMIADLNEDTRPEVFDDMGVPSNEDIANCVCDNLPDMTDEELIEWLDNEDMDPINNEEDKEQFEFLIRCMGFDSFEDYMRKMMQMMNPEMELE